MKKTTRILATAALMTALALPAVAQDAPSAGTVLARVGDTEITLGHAIALRDTLPQQFRTVPDATLFPAIVEQLIEQELLAQFKGDDLTARERVTLDNELRNFAANAALMEAATAALTDESVAMAYAAFTEAYSQGEPTPEWNAAHILVRTEDEITEVVTEIEAGRDFADVARAFSIDGSAAQGGGLGWFGPGMMIEPFEAAVAALEPGQVSAPVQTRFGWHVIQLNETRMATVPALEEVRAELEQQIQREAARALVDRLRADAVIEDLAADIDPALLSRGDLLDD